MTLSIGRRGWTGIGIQTAKDAPAAPTDYLPWDTNTMAQVTEQLPVTDAHGIRDSNFNSVPSKQFSNGQFKMLAYPNLIGYLIYGAMGTVSSTSPAAGVNVHTFTENQSNVPLFLSLINNRVVDQEYYPNCIVQSLDLMVGIDLATVDCKMLGDVAFQTTSGSFQTASGNIWSFKQALFGIGSSIANARANTFKTISVKATIENGSEAVFAHGSARPYALIHKDLKFVAEIELYFENTTDKNNFYNQVKQSAVLQFVGNPLGSNTGFNELLEIDVYQITFKTFTVNTGLDTLQTEKVQISGEYSVPNSATIGCILTNGNSNY